MRKMGIEKESEKLKDVLVWCLSVLKLSARCKVLVLLVAMPLLKVSKLWLLGGYLLA